MKEGEKGASDKYTFRGAEKKKEKNDRKKEENGYFGQIKIATKRLTKYFFKPKIYRN